jgi:hypothetical protein
MTTSHLKTEAEPNPETSYKSNTIQIIDNVQYSICIINHILTNYTVPQKWLVGWLVT